MRNIFTFWSVQPPRMYEFSTDYGLVFDDANTNLFNRLIKDVASKSQIVMITHNKSTMEVADSLFGVTMQKQGISSLVSVNFN